MSKTSNDQIFDFFFFFNFERIEKDREEDFDQNNNWILKIK